MADNTDYRQILTDKLIEHLEAGTAPWQKPWDAKGGSVRLPFNPVTGKEYRGANSLFLTMNGRSDPRWATYKQAAEQGWQVRKGEKGALIEYWKFSDSMPAVDSSGKPIMGDDGKQKTVSVLLEKPKVFRAVVFNAEQMDGMPELSKAPRQYEWDPIERADAILQSSGAKLFHDQADRAFYSPAKDEIHLPGRDQFKDQTAYYSTALHELGHWTGHESRLRREFGGSFGSVEYAKEELRAELSSYFMADKLGIPHDPGQHAAYVKSWIRVLQEDKNEIFRAARDAEKIVEYVAGLAQERGISQSNDLSNKQAHELTFAQFSSIAKVSELENHGRKYEVSGFGEHAFSDAATPVEAVRDVHRAMVNNALYWNERALDAEIPESQKRDVSMPPSEVIAEYPQLREKFPRLFANRIATTDKGPMNMLLNYESLTLINDGLLAVDSTKGHSHERDAVNAARQVVRQIVQEEFAYDISIGNDPADEPFRFYQLNSEQIETLREGLISAEYMHPNNALEANIIAVENAKRHFDQNEKQQAAGLAPIIPRRPSRGPTDPEYENSVSERGSAEENLEASGLNQAASVRTILQVPFKDKEAAKGLGAKWDKDAKVWFAPPGADLGKLDKWLVKPEIPSAPLVNPPEVDFAMALKENGLVIDGLPIMDGKIHRVPVEGKGPRSKDGAYVGYLDGNPSGFIQNFSAGTKTTWTQSGVSLSPEERAQMQAHVQLMKEQREAELAALNASVADKSVEKWQRLDKLHIDRPDNDYLERKGVMAVNVRADGEKLVVPLRDIDGKLWSLQSISSNEGAPKIFEKGGLKKGNFSVFSLDQKTWDTGAANFDALAFHKPSQPILVAEGYATAATIGRATNETVVVAFDSGNIDPVVESLKNRFPMAPIFICADNDQHQVNNVGVEKAWEAAEKHKVGIVIPELVVVSSDSYSALLKGTDFNDLELANGTHGKQAVADQIKPHIQGSMQKSREFAAKVWGFSMQPAKTCSKSICKDRGVER